METKNKARMSAPETTVAQREEKYKEQGIQVQSKFLKWLDNYWYHYKWHTILIGFFAFVMIVCFVQCSTAEDHDVTVCFSGNEIFLENEYAEIKKVLGDVCPFDANQDGDNTAAFKTISAFSGEQLEAQFTYYYEETDEWKLDKDGMNLYRSTNVENIDNVRSYVMTGDCAIWFVSPFIYEECFKELITETVKLSETVLYRDYDVIKLMPEDTLVVLLRPVMGAYSKDQAYKQAESYYRAIVGEQ